MLNGATSKVCRLYKTIGFHNEAMAMSVRSLDPSQDRLNLFYIEKPDGIVSSFSFPSTMRTYKPSANGNTA